MEEVECEFNCPNCGAPISVLVDTSVLPQVYVEDCEVCCRPIEISYRLEDERLLFEAARMD
jgi:transcription elongation factor Elf1